MPRFSVIGYHPEPLADLAAQRAKLRALIRGSDLALLPEYAGMEAALIAASHIAPEAVLSWRDRAADLAEDWAALLSDLARSEGTWITGATIPARTPRGVVNRGFLVSPTGAVHHQDKLILTPYERDTLSMVPGDGLTLIEAPWGRFGMLICYDCEFPLLARALAEAGADVILVPSCTDTAAGQTRVRQSARARALEGQCLVLQAPLLGDVPACGIIDVNTGRAGAFVPPDGALPPDGIWADGAPDTSGALRFEADLSTISAPRSAGETRNRAHWPEQHARDLRVTILGG